MNKTITVEVRNKVAAQTNRVEYVCGNSDFLIVFDFDDEWAAFEAKTARFIHSGTHIDIVFRGNQCAVPVMSDTHSFHVGVFAGDLRTTTAAYIPAKKSILCDAGVPADPAPDVYNQIMDKVNEVAEEAAQPVSWNDLEDRPFYEEKTQVDLLPGTEIELVSGQCDVNVDFALVLGNKYIVNWNGRKYECIADSIEEDWVSLVEDGLFTIEQLSGSNEITVYTHDGSDYAEVGIYEPNEILKPIDPKFLPETVVTDEEMAQAMEGLATEEYVNRATTGLASETFVEQAIREAEQDDFSGSWNDLNDKPFYEESGAIEIFPETELEYDSDMDLFPLPDLELVVGDTYIVTWNGTEYECVASSEGVGDEQYVILGGNDYPFHIDVTSDEVYSLDGSTEATLQICHVGGIAVHPIDLKFLPEEVVTHDELNATLNGYATEKYVDTAISEASGSKEVKWEDVTGKPFADGYLLPETTIELDAGMGGCAVDFVLAPNRTYFVTLNGTEYELVASRSDDVVELSNAVFYIEQYDDYQGAIEVYVWDVPEKSSATLSIKDSNDGKIYSECLPTETWTFTLEDGTVIEKKVVVAT